MRFPNQALQFPQSGCLKGEISKDGSWHGNVEIATISISRLHWAVLLIFIQKMYFFASNLCSSRHGPAGSLFINVKLKKISLWHISYFCHIFWPYLCHWQRHLGTKWQHSWWCFCNFYTSVLTNSTRNQVKNCCVSIFHSILINIIINVSMLHLPFKIKWSSDQRSILDSVVKRKSVSFRKDPPRLAASLNRF